MPDTNRPRKQGRLIENNIRIAGTIAILFFLKATILALFITPLWDIPDETGHFAYARDLYSGRGIPVLGESVIEADIISNVNQTTTASSQHNWIAQHPPTYYLVAGSFWKIASFFTDSQEILFRIPRLSSAIAGALSVFFLFKLIYLIFPDIVVSAAFASMLGFIPMFSHLSSGTSHDTTLVLFSILAVFFWARFILTGQKKKDAYWTAFWLGMAVFTKLTALVLAVPLLTIALFEITGSWKYRLGVMARVTVIFLILPGLWMSWSLYQYGAPLVAAHDIMPTWRLADNPLNDSLGSFLRTQPVFEGFFIHFWGLFGWFGTGAGEFRAKGLISWHVDVYTFVVLTAVALCFTVSLRRTFRRAYHTVHLREPSDSLRKLLARTGSTTTGQTIVRLLSLTFVVISFRLTWDYSYLQPFGNPVTRRVLYSSIVALGTLSIFALFIPNDKRSRLMGYGWIVTVFFVAVVVLQVYPFYLLDGQLRAIHGRYFYPLLPLVFASISVLLRQVLVKKARILHVSLVLLAISLAYLELDVFFTQVLPFYKGSLL